MSGYVDLQVNGYAGVDFNSDTISADDVATVCRRLGEDGVESILATIITAPLELMQRRIARLADLIETAPEIAATVVGIHIEGPFLNPADGFVGAHPVDCVQSADVETAQRLAAAGRSHVRILTLAPEMDSNAQVTGAMTREGIIVAAGHSDASIDQLNHAIDHGLKLFTHLGNGCPAVLPRHDNIVQRVLSVSDRLKVSFIADGHHVPPFALKNYLQRVPNDNIVIVTDAIGAAGLGPGQYQLAGQTVDVDEAGAAWAAGRTHFAGSAATLPRMIEILQGSVGASQEEIQQWMRINPSRLLADGN